MIGCSRRDEEQASGPRRDAPACSMREEHERTSMRMDLGTNECHHRSGQIGPLTFQRPRQAPDIVGARACVSAPRSVAETASASFRVYYRAGGLSGRWRCAQRLRAASRPRRLTSSSSGDGRRGLGRRRWWLRRWPPRRVAQRRPAAIGVAYTKRLTFPYFRSHEFSRYQKLWRRLFFYQAGLERLLVRLSDKIVDLYLFLNFLQRSY